MAKRTKKLDVGSTIIIFSLFVLDGILWQSIIKNAGIVSPRLYFFNVAQGSSELVLLPGPISIMVDSGGDNAIVQKLDAVLSPINDGHIDIAIISYPQIYNYAGYNYILDHYSVGAFLYDGRNDIQNKTAWSQFMAKLHAKKIPLITIARGDGIRIESNVINVLSPDNDLSHSADITDAALVEHVSMPEFSTLLASDIGESVAQELLLNASAIHSTILKVPFPLVGESPGKNFLQTVGPKIAVVVPGIKNAASGASKAMITTLTSSTNALIMQPSLDGTLMIDSNNGKLNISKEK